MLNSKFMLLSLANAAVGESTQRGYESQRATSESALDRQEAGLEISPLSLQLCGFGHNIIFNVTNSDDLTCFSYQARAQRDCLEGDF